MILSNYLLIKITESNLFDYINNLNKLIRTNSPTKITNNSNIIIKVRKLITLTKYIYKN
jgi:hypothetical protein